MPTLTGCHGRVDHRRGGRVTMATTASDTPPAVTAAAAAPLINFFTGHPSSELLAAAAPLIKDAAEAFASQPPSVAAEGLSYHANDGNASVREALATFINSALRADGTTPMPDPVTVDDLFLVPGCSQGLEMLSAHLRTLGLSASDGAMGDAALLDLRSKTVAVMEEPSYFLAKQVFLDNGLTPVGVPVDDDGMRVDVLRARLESGTLQPVRFVYTIPIHHNPTSVTMSADRRRELVKLSKEYGFVVLADEVYQHLGFSATAAGSSEGAGISAAAGAGDATVGAAAAPPPPPLASYDTSDPRSVISIGSLSKILSPAVRVGWLHGHPSLLKQLLRAGYLESGGSLCGITGCLVEAAIRSGAMEKRRSHVRDAYSAGATALCDALEEHFPSGSSPLLEFRRPRGGYFVWCNVTRGDANEFATLAQEHHGVRVLPGERCGVGGGGDGDARKHNTIRLCFAMLTTEEMAEGARRLAAAAREFDA